MLTMNTSIRTNKDTAYMSTAPPLTPTFFSRQHLHIHTLPGEIPLLNSHQLPVRVAGLTRDGKMGFGTRVPTFQIARIWNKPFFFSRAPVSKAWLSWQQAVRSMFCYKIFIENFENFWLIMWFWKTIHIYICIRISQTCTCPRHCTCAGKPEKARNFGWP